MTARRVAVIGGGLSGLAAAAALRTLGMEPTVFEAATTVGGVVRSEADGDWMIDSGPCLAAQPDAVVRALLDTAGASSCVIRADAAAAHRFLVHDGAPIPLPHTLSEFTASPLLSLAGRLRLVKERFIPVRRDAPEETVDEFARRRFGDEVADRMFDPLVACMAAGNPRELLARFAFPSTVGHEQRSGSGLQGSLRARMEARRRSRGGPAGAWSCAEGMQQLARRLAEYAGSVQTGAPVRSVIGHDARLQVAVAGGVPAEFDAAIFAVPAPALAGIEVALPEAQRLAQVAGIPHRSIAAVSLGFRRDQVAHPLDGSRLLIPSLEQRALLSVVFPSSLFAGRAPLDHVLLTAYVGGSRSAAAIDLPEAGLVELVMRELSSLLGINGEPVQQRVTVWRDALPQAVAGHARRLAAADVVEATAGSVAFAGAWHDGLSVAEVLLGGMRAAERLAVRKGWLGGSPAVWHA